MDKSPQYEIEAVITFAKELDHEFKTAPVDELTVLVQQRFSNVLLLQTITALYRAGFRRKNDLTKLIPDSRANDTAYLSELAKKARWLACARDTIGRMKQLSILTLDEMQEGFARVQGLLDDVESEIEAQRFAANFIFQIKGGATSDSNNEADLLCLDSGLSHSKGVQLVRVPWRILPPGDHPYPAILEHFDSLAERYRHLKPQRERLHKIFKLEPTVVIIGEGEFEWYAIFLFKDSDKAILECPYYGNATYIIKGDWISLSKLTKKELIKDYPRKYHSDDWFLWVKKSLGKTITTE